jgi:hypothetical protein
MADVDRVLSLSMHMQYVGPELTLSGNLHVVLQLDPNWTTVLHLQDCGTVTVAIIHCTVVKLTEF